MSINVVKINLEINKLLSPMFPKKERQTIDITFFNDHVSKEKLVDQTITITMDESEILQNIHEAISLLDLESPEFSSKISKILTSLENYFHLFPQNADKIKELIYALKTLQDPKGFDETVLEGKVLNVFKTVLKNAGLETNYLPNNTKNISNGARNEFLKFLKSSKSSEELLSTNFNNKISELRYKAIQNRLCSLGQISSDESKDAIRNVLNLIVFLRRLEKNYGKYVNEAIHAVYQICNKNSSGRFSVLIEHYPDYDLRKVPFVDEEIDNFLTQLSSPSMSEIMGISSEEFKETLNPLFEKHLHNCEEKFLSTFENYRTTYDLVAKTLAIL